MKIKCFKNVSAKCTAAVMAASMVLTPVAGALAFPMGIYAVDYQSTADIPADDSGHKNLTSADTLALNDGTIYINEGTITLNEGTVSINAVTGTVTENANTGVITDNYGTVGEASSGTVGINHTGGTVNCCDVTDNYGEAINCQVTNNYASGTVTGEDSNVTNNWGTVTDVNSVTNNCGTVKDNIPSDHFIGSVPIGETEVTNNYSGGTIILRCGSEGTSSYSGSDIGPVPEAGKESDPQPPAQTTPNTAPAQPSSAPVQYEAANDVPNSRISVFGESSPEEAVNLSNAAICDPIALSGGATIIASACDVSTISLAKTDVVYDPAVINSLKNLHIGSQYGVPNVTGAGMIAASDGRAIKSQTVNIECAGLTSAKQVAVLVYTLNSDGTKTVRVVKPRFSKGKLKVQLPVPCEYVIVQNVSVQ